MQPCALCAALTGDESPLARTAEVCFRCLCAATEGIAPPPTAQLRVATMGPIGGCAAGCVDCSRYGVQIPLCDACDAHLKAPAVAVGDYKVQRDDGEVWFTCSFELATQVAALKAGMPPLDDNATAALHTKVTEQGAAALGTVTVSVIT